MTHLPESTLFTLDDLRQIMRSCVGLDESVDLDGDIGGATFEDLGYDSLAVLETITRVGNKVGLVIPDDTAEKLNTPQSLVDYVTTQLAG
jgi:act minimal PKS acyl carrier protein